MSTVDTQVPAGLRLTSVMQKSHQSAVQVASVFGRTAMMTSVTTQIVSTAVIAEEAELDRRARSRNGTDINAAPQLRSPNMAMLQSSSASRGMTPEAFLTWAAMKAGDLKGQQSIDSLNNRAAAWSQLLVQREAQIARLNQALENAKAELDVAIGDAEKAAEDAGDALLELKEGREQATLAEKAWKDLSQLQHSLRQQAEAYFRETGKQLTAEEFDRVLNTLAKNHGYEGLSDLQAHVLRADQLYQGTTKELPQLEQAAKDALARSEAAAKALEQKMGRVVGLESDIRRLQNTPLQLTSAGSESSHRTLNARLTELMALLQQVLGYSREVGMQTAAEAAIEAVKANETELLRVAEEREEELRKAEATSQWLGCLGKIIGWLVTVIAAIAAPFTGGASMALAAVGLAMAIAEEATGFSVLGQVLQPLIEFVQLLATEITKLFTSILESFGVIDAKKVAEILGAITAALMMVALMAAAFLVSKAALAKMIPAITKQVAQLMGKEIGKEVAKQSGKEVAKQGVKATMQTFMAQHAGNIQAGATAVGGVTQVGVASGNVVVADMHVTAAELAARQGLIIFDMTQLNKTLEALQEAMSELEQLVARLVQSLDSTMTSRRNTAKAFAANLRAV